MKYIFVFFLLLPFFACVKDVLPPVGTGNQLVVTTGEATELTPYSAVVYITVQTMDPNYPMQVVTQGVLWDTTQEVTSASNSVYATGSGSSYLSTYGSDYTAAINGLQPGQTYYACGYVLLEQNTYVYGAVISFKTSN
jgi:hypothetical protein